MAVKGRVMVSDKYCKGCELCVGACPQEALQLAVDRITAKGYHPAALAAKAAPAAGFAPWFARRPRSRSTAKPSTSAIPNCRRYKWRAS